jgi:hypothetical protein
MALSEGVQARLAYKFYASGVMASGSEPVAATAPGASGGQLLRRVSHSLNLRKNTYRSAEIRPDRQVGDFRHGGRRVEGSISGEFSPGTYFDFIEAAHRDTKVAALALSDTEFTSITSDSTTSSFTLTAGDPVSSGLRVGDVIRFTGLATAANNSRNFTITGFSGTSNRVIAVSPAPTTDAVADTAFSLARPGSATIVPASAHVSRLVAFEDHDEAIDASRLFTECRVAGYRIGMPAEGMATFETMVMGRNMQVLSGDSAPFFASPAAVTSTGIGAAANGLLMVGGTAIGVVTGIDLTFNMSAEAPSVVGQVFPPEIFLGTADVTGTINALFEDDVLIGNYLDEDEISVLVRVDAGGGDAPEAVCIYLPRIKFTGGDVQRQGEGAQPLSLPFQALRYQGSAAGVETTTIRIHDTAAT